MTNLDPKPILLKVLLLGLLSAAIGLFIHSQQIRFPANIAISVTESTPGFIKIYYTQGRGWNEDDSSSTRLSGSQEIAKLGLPLKQIDHYRIDPAQGDVRIVIEQLCFASILRRVCWGAQELQKKMVPFNGVVSHKMVDGGLEIITEGHDPYFAFAGNDSLHHLTVSKLKPLELIIWSVVLAGLIYGLWKCRRWFFSRLKTLHHHAKAKQYSMGIGQAGMVVSLFSVIISLAWLGIYELGPAVYLGVISLVLAVVVIGSEPEFSPSNYLKETTHLIGIFKNQSKEIALVAGLTLLPIVYLLGATWSQEFPNFGDHEYHWRSNKYIYHLVVDQALLLTTLLLGMIVSMALGMVGLFCLLCVALLIWVGSGIELVEAMVRYPGGARLFNIPFVHLALGSEMSFFNAGRLSSAFSVFTWLFFLRPLIIRKWPTISILPFALVLFYQAEMVYFFTSVYLEPWALVFIALAVELLLISPGKNSYLKACLLVGTAAVIKEPAIFLVPWFWLAGRPWSKGIKHFKNAVLVGIASVMPFVIYYFVRNFHGVNRFESAGFDYFLTESWWAEIGHRMGYHLGGPGIVLMSLIAVYWIYLLVRKQKGVDRFALICLFGSAMSVLIMFNIDFSGRSYTGYFRFYLPIYLLFVSPLLLVGVAAGEKKLTAGFVSIACLVVLAGNGPRLFEYLALTFGHDAERNFTEHYDSPIFLPIKSLIKKAEAANALGADSAEFIHVNHVTGWNQPRSGYPELDKKYDLRMDPELVCECSEKNKVVLAPFVHYAGLNERLLEPNIEDIDQLPRNYINSWTKSLSVKQQCLLSLEKTCDFYVQEDIDGEAIGGLGIKYSSP